MLVVPTELTRRYEARLAQQNLMAEQRPHDHQWLRYDLDFCHKYSFAPTDRLSWPAFQEKLRAKHQPESPCQQAGHAVSLCYEMVSPADTGLRLAADAAKQQGIGTRNVAHQALERTPHGSSVAKPLVESSAPPSAPAQFTPQAAPHCH